jgi:GTP-binding protein
MGKPTVAIIGRPNVGKSTFFNYIAGKRISIVEDTPGVTRDRVYAEANWRGRNFMLVDTGGIEPESSDVILSQMRRQAEIAIEVADVIVFITDMKQGVTAADSDIALMLKKSKKPIILVCNKADNFGKMPNEIYEFYNLGLGEPHRVSAANAIGIGDVLDAIYEKLPPMEDDELENEEIKVAVIGKPNVGKSSLINKILGENRVIVSNIAGTTRDAIDSEFENEFGKYVFIDTAGIRRKSKVSENLEKYSVLRSMLAIERADVCLLMIDANEGVTEQDTKIAGEAHEAGKGIIILVNKWDEYKKENGTLEQYQKDVYNKLSYLSYAPILFISAKTGQRVNKLFELINSVASQNSLRVSTSTLNQVLNEAIAIVQPPTDKGKRLRIFYMTQASTKPPTFVVFVNDKDLFHFSYERYLVNQIRKEFGLVGTPIRMIVREKNEKDI